jgi:hypothetical protein
MIEQQESSKHLEEKGSTPHGKLVADRPVVPVVLCDVFYDFCIKICSVRFHYYLFCSRREFMLFVCINPYWRQTPFPSWMMLVSYSNTTGTTGRSATSFPCGVLPFSSKCLLDSCCSIISVPTIVPLWENKFEDTNG